MSINIRPIQFQAQQETSTSFFQATTLETIYGRPRVTNLTGNYHESQLRFPY